MASKGKKKERARERTTTRYSVSMYNMYICIYMKERETGKREREKEIMTTTPST